MLRSQVAASACERPPLTQRPFISLTNETSEVKAINDAATRSASTACRFAHTTAKSTGMTIVLPQSGPKHQKDGLIAPNAGRPATAGLGAQLLHKESMGLSSYCAIYENSGSRLAYGVRRASWARRRKATPNGCDGKYLPKWKVVSYNDS